MNNLIIKSINLKKRNPLISFFLSLFITGLGQIYNGEISRGFAFFLIRTVLVMFIPIFVSTNPDANHTSTFLITFAFLFVIIISSAVEALLFSKSKKEKKTSKYNSILFYFIFSLLNIFITALMMIILFSFFNITKITTYENILKKKLDEYILINKYYGNAYTKGDLILFDDESYYKIIASESDSISFKKNTFYINSKKITTFNKNKINSLENNFLNINLPNYKNKKNKNYKLMKNEYLIQNTNKTYGDVFHLVKTESLRGRIEGIIFSWKFHRLFSMDVQ